MAWLLSARSRKRSETVWERLGTARDGFETLGGKRSESVCKRLENVPKRFGRETFKERFLNAGKGSKWSVDGPSHSAAEALPERLGMGSGAGRPRERQDFFWEAKALGELGGAGTPWEALGGPGRPWIGGLGRSWEVCRPWEVILLRSKKLQSAVDGAHSPTE